MVERGRKSQGKIEVEKIEESGVLRRRGKMEEHEEEGEVEDFCCYCQSVEAQ